MDSISEKRPDLKGEEVKHKRKGSFAQKPQIIQEQKRRRNTVICFTDRLDSPLIDVQNLDSEKKDKK